MCTVVCKFERAREEESKAGGDIAGGGGGGGRERAHTIHKNVI